MMRNQISHINEGGGVIHYSAKITIKKKERNYFKRKKGLGS